MKMKSINEIILRSVNILIFSFFILLFIFIGLRVRIDCVSFINGNQTILSLTLILIIIGSIKLFKHLYKRAVYKNCPKDSVGNYILSGDKCLVVDLNQNLLHKTTAGIFNKVYCVHNKEGYMFIIDDIHKNDLQLILLLKTEDF